MNFVLLATLLAGFGAQLLKLILYFFQHKSLNVKDIVVTGGMPSSHSAFVVALSTSIYLDEGASTAFAITLVLAMIVIRDAFGVRRTVGEEGVMITTILKKLKLHKETHFAMGHTPAQVAVGSLIGFVVPLLVYYLG
ncbi:divergent PAP2 family protein [Candidatus Woesearchaeota archaeon]|nr:divergent PAP2 family protein [Candidatus Woesearchaeota archaeon]